MLFYEYFCSMKTDLNKLKEHLLNLKDSLEIDKIILDKNISALSSIVERFYSKSNPYQERVKYLTGAISQLKIFKRDNNPMYGFSTESIKNEMSDLIDNIIQEIDNIGLPDNDLKIDKSINITNTLSQSQTQSIELNFVLDILKDELNGKQIKEIKEIIEGEEEISSKTEKLVNKLKSFGENVLASMVASLITNPNIFAQL